MCCCLERIIGAGDKPAELIEAKNQSEKLTGLMENIPQQIRVRKTKDGSQITIERVL